MIPIEDTLDLHTFRPRDVPLVLEEYLWEALRRGLPEVRIIHGKGIGVQRRIVAAVLERHPAVASFRQASAERGHWGATIVQLQAVTRDASAIGRSDRSGEGPGTEPDHHKNDAADSQYPRQEQRGHDQTR